MSGEPVLTQVMSIIPVGNIADSTNPLGNVGDPPAAITDFSATPGSTSVLLTWTPVAGTLTIYLRDVTAAGSFVEVATGISGAAGQYEVTGITPANQYEARNTVTTAAGTSGNSNTVSFTTSEASEVPAGTYDLTDGVFTFTAPEGVNFGTKPHGDQAYFVAFADEGFVPSGMGRLETWNHAAYNGTASDDFVAPGATTSAFFDLGLSSGGAFGQIDFPHEPLSIVVNRAVYCDYTQQSAISARMRHGNVIGVTMAGGQWLKGRTSGATGKVNRTGPTSGGWPTVYIEKTVGTVTYPTPTAMFVRDETMDVFAAADVIAFATAKGSTESAVLALYDDSDPEYPTPLGTAENEENDGIFYTFNHKVFRIWESGAQYINAYHSTNPDRVTATTEGGNSEQDGEVKTTWYDYSWSMDDYSNKWTMETFVHRNTSEINTYTGKRLWKADGVEMFYGLNSRLQTTQYPNRQRRVSMMQVSNGAEPGTRVFMNHVIMDDSEYQVFLVNAANKELMLPPITWNPASNNQITAHDLPYLPDWTHAEIRINQSVVATFERQP